MGLPNRRIDSLDLSSAQESPYSGFGELIAYARRTRRKATAGTVAFSYWVESQLPDFVIAQHLNEPILLNLP